MQAHAVAFTGYPVAHDPQQRRPMAMVARPWRECGLWQMKAILALAGACAAALFLVAGGSARAQTEPPRKLTWHPLEFAILRYNDDAPKSWNIYHSDKKGILLVRLWKRYLLVSVQDEEVYDIDPQTIKASGESVEWSYADRPPKPIETPDWRVRNVGSMDRVRFRLGKDGHFLELQLPLGPNGRPIY